MVVGSRRERAGLKNFKVGMKSPHGSKKVGGTPTATGAVVGFYMAYDL